ncbi:MAG: hypothetical protein WAM71_18015 [Candidatus Korobacteraceae bacterium]
MTRRSRDKQKKDHSDTAFMIAAFAGCATVVVCEDVYYFATDVVFWNTWRLHPCSVFIGTLVFLLTLYLMQRLNKGNDALRYLGPYTPLLGASGANLAVKLNGFWLFPVMLLSIVWSVVQVRHLQEVK